MLNFTLTDLRYLLALDETRHFARAAQKCFVSQPTLSIAIRKLEDNLGISIFEREGQQILLTSAGNEVIQQARKILTEAQQLLSIAKIDQDPYLQPLRIGAILTIGPYLFPKLIQNIMLKLPKLQLVIEESYTNALVEKLLGGELDVIILATKIQHPEIEQIVFHQDQLNLICASKHPLAKVAKITNKRLADEAFLLLGVGNCFRDQVLQVCPECSVASGQFSNLITTSSLETIKYMVAMNLGVSILPALAANNLPPEVILKPFSGNPPHRELSLVFRKNFARQNLLSQLRELLQESL